MKKKSLIQTDNKRPLNISITKVGKSAKSSIIKDIFRFKNNKNKNSKELVKSIEPEIPNAIEKNIMRNLALRNQNSNKKKTHLVRYPEKPAVDEESKEILMSFFIELPEILLDIDANLTIDQYDKFKRSIKAFLSRFNLKI